VLTRLSQTANIDQIYRKLDLSELVNSKTHPFLSIKERVKQTIHTLEAIAVFMSY
jgi:hypothetical protein